jgi:prepilin-type N-terminal cleavage/methylation domain-containing protein
MKIPCAALNDEAFTLIEMLLVIFMIAVLAVLLLPSLAGSHKSTRIYCVNNLKQIGLAFRIWEGDNGDKFPMKISATNTIAMNFITVGKTYVFWRNISNELSTPKVLYCTADTAKAAATNFTSDFSDANISYFFNLDGKESDPQTILTGDDNLAVNDVPARTGTLTLSTNSSVAWTSARHKFVGNIGIADGSVQQVNTHGLLSVISNAVAPSRFVIP